MKTLSLKGPRSSLISGMGALILLLAGCSGDDGATSATTGEESTTTDATTSGTSTTSSATTSGTSTGTAGETSSSTSGDPSTTDATAGTTAGTTEGTTVGTTTEDPTAGTTEDPTGGVVDGMKSCEIACETIAPCIGLPTELCVADCMEDFAMSDSAECEAAKIEFNVCLGTLTCENIDNQDLGECEPLAVAADAACGGGVEPPVCEASKMTMGNGCTHNFDCGDVVYGMKCNNMGCQCLVDGVTMGGCPNMMYCPLEGDEAAAAAALCCGFDL